MRFVYGLVGALVGACTNLAINLLAAAIQQRSFDGHFSDENMVWLIGLIVIGLLLGLWLGAIVTLKPQNNNQAIHSAPVLSHADQPLTMTRFRALLSYGKLRGRGIVLTDIMMVGSVLDIDTRARSNCYENSDDRPRGCG